jgi:hypothetical protein
MKLSYDPEVDALRIVFRETTVTTKLGSDVPPKRVKRANGQSRGTVQGLIPRRKAQ